MKDVKDMTETTEATDTTDTTDTAKAKKPAPPLLGCYDDLAGTLGYAWAMLARGVKDRKSSFHTPTIATTGLDGTPRLRTVVLRGCDVTAGTLRFHTDRRSGKIAEFEKSPAAAIHIYDAQSKIQLRLAAQLRVLDGDAFAAAWSATRPMSRECYQVTTAPGAPIADPYEAGFDAAASQEGELYFAPVEAAVTSIEWLYLAARGHRRARFELTGDTPQMTWLVP